MCECEEVSVAEVEYAISNLHIDNLDYADIVRGSYEDFLTLYKKDNSDKVYNAEISFYCRNFIYTHGAEPVEVYGNGGFSKHYDVPPSPVLPCAV